MMKISVNPILDGILFGEIIYIYVINKLLFIS